MNNFLLFQLYKMIAILKSLFYVFLRKPAINELSMNYLQLFHTFQSHINLQDDNIKIGDIIVHNESFRSDAVEVLIGHPRYSCLEHGLTFANPDEQTISEIKDQRFVDNHDADVEENHLFRYHIFNPSKNGKIRQLIFLLHGFNEKHWKKYYPWAWQLACETGKALVLFPIAFHMNRAPAPWAERRSMFKLSESRKMQYPNILKSSLSNAAISTRLHSHPERFIWSGLETYYDIIRFVGNCKAGKHPFIDKNCTFDFFSYSIGSLLAEILKLTDHKGYFSGSKLCMFCGGAVFNRLSPVSKFILDSEANVALYSFLVEHIDSHMKRDRRLAHFLSSKHPEGFNFFSMLDYKINMEYREGKFRAIHDQVYAITLKQDKVVPFYEVVNTLTGSSRDIGIKVDVLDFPYVYFHEDPFPVEGVPHDLVNRSFELVFGKACSFLK